MTSVSGLSATPQPEDAPGSFVIGTGAAAANVDVPSALLHGDAVFQQIHKDYIDAARRVATAAQAHLLSLSNIRDLAQRLRVVDLAVQSSSLNTEDAIVGLLEQCDLIQQSIDDLPGSMEGKGCVLHLEQTRQELSQYHQYCEGLLHDGLVRFCQDKVLSLAATVNNTIRRFADPPDTVANAVEFLSDLVTAERLQDVRGEDYHACMRLHGLVRRRNLHLDQQATEAIKELPFNYRGMHNAVVTVVAQRPNYVTKFLLLLRRDLHGIKVNLLFFFFFLMKGRSRLYFFVSLWFCAADLSFSSPVFLFFTGPSLLFFCTNTPLGSSCCCCSSFSLFFPFSLSVCLSLCLPLSLSLSPSFPPSVSLSLFYHPPSHQNLHLQPADHNLCLPSFLAIHLRLLLFQLHTAWAQVQLSSLRGKILHPSLLAEGQPQTMLEELKGLQARLDGYHAHLKDFGLREDYLLHGAIETLEDFRRQHELGISSLQSTAQLRESQTDDCLRDIGYLTTYAGHLRQFWTTAGRWASCESQWSKAPLMQLDPTALQSVVTDTLSQLRDARSSLPKGEAVSALMERVLQFSGLVDVLASLHVDIKQRHWPQLEAILRHQYNPSWLSLEKLGQLGTTVEKDGKSGEGGRTNRRRMRSEGGGERGAGCLWLFAVY